MATLLTFQGKGLGQHIIDTLLAQIHEQAPENPYITLIADPPGRRLYEKTGFSEINPSRDKDLDECPTSKELGHSPTETLPGVTVNSRWRLSPARYGGCA